jgi:hypothetical protein
MKILKNYPRKIDVENKKGEGEYQSRRKKSILETDMILIVN